MNEFKFIETIKQSVYNQSALRKGVGDDAAVFRQTAQDIVTAMDTFVENVHFSKDTMSPEAIGYRVLAVNLSDMAAMGAIPAFYMVSIVAPQDWSETELRGIFQGMRRLARVYTIDLIGGDTVSGGELSLTVTVIGFVDQQNARYRNAAQKDDIIFVTGTLGDAAAGLHILLNPGNYVNRDYLVQRHINPQPRVHFARNLQSINRLALNDISDGIANEACEIARASKVSLHLMQDFIPRHMSLHQFPKALADQWVYFGGEDFELIGTVAKENWKTVQTAAKQSGTSVSRIGYVSGDNESGGDAVYLHEHDRVNKLGPNGYQHGK